ncbi:type VII secretion protein EccB [Saccharopolyspora indica]|uniref:type VII secretion protein EccB n=1 Tax=Saccharopolyspora indica TaxID=1229659 RepID=UPI0022EA76D9|nr:type VII secretion protein EccB [Saccharopolyspora indica]MDA3647483.1 type VII secretion protein EccB [Saccharopolyspora indica]
MATTREQSEAYSYENRRRATSLIRGTDEAMHDPRRRLNRALAGGLAIGVLIAAGFGVVGWLGGGRGPGLPDSGAVVASGSGDRYVMSDGVAHPALNLASALLVGGGTVTTVKPSALEEVPRGLPVGIPFAPDALPAAEALTEEEWTVCAVPPSAEGVAPRVAAYVGIRLSPAESADVVVQDPSGASWLVSGGQRFLMPDSARTMLGLQRAAAVRLPTEVLATVPEGPALSIPSAVDGAGAVPAFRLPGEVKVGDLVHTDGVNPQHYLVHRDGLASITPLVHRLMSAHATADHLLPAGVAATAPQVGAGPGEALWPDAVPEVVELSRNQPMCVSTPPGSTPGDTPWRVVVHTPARMPEPAKAVSAADGAALGLLSAIHVPPGSGAVVRASTAAGTAGTHTLITDAGLAYPFSSPEAVRRLRYDPATAPSVPKPFVDLLPAGPVLDPAAAALEHRGEGR